MGHVGLTPQAIHRHGRLPRAGAQERRRGSGCSRTRGPCRRRAPSPWCSRASRRSWPRRSRPRARDPTIGIGAGVDCDGQVLVMHDMLGLSDWTPSFVKQYANLGARRPGRARLRGRGGETASSPTRTPQPTATASSRVTDGDHRDTTVRAPGSRRRRARSRVDASRWCRPWARSTRGTSSLVKRAHAKARRWCGSRSSSIRRQFNDSRKILRRYPRPISRGRPRRCARRTGRRHRHSCTDDGRGAVPRWRDQTWVDVENLTRWPVRCESARATSAVSTTVVTRSCFHGRASPTSPIFGEKDLSTARRAAAAWRGISRFGIEVMGAADRCASPMGVALSSRNRLLAPSAQRRGAQRPGDRAGARRGRGARCAGGEVRSRARRCWTLRRRSSSWGTIPRPASTTSELRDPRSPSRRAPDTSAGAVRARAGA